VVDHVWSQEHAIAWDSQGPNESCATTRRNEHGRSRSKYQRQHQAFEPRFPILTKARREGGRIWRQNQGCPDGMRLQRGDPKRIGRECASTQDPCVPLGYRFPRKEVAGRSVVAISEVGLKGGILRDGNYRSNSSGNVARLG